MAFAAIGLNDAIDTPLPLPDRLAPSGDYLWSQSPLQCAYSVRHLQLIHAQTRPRSQDYTAVRLD